MDYRSHLEQLRAMPACEVEECLKQLRECSPTPGAWPGGMPASIDPKLVIVGVSPGSSGEIDPRHPADSTEPDPMPAGKPHPGFFSKDGRNYWEKIRRLSTSYFSSLDNTFHVCDSACNSHSSCCCEALCLTAHLNLGNGEAGDAKDAEFPPDHVERVATLISRVWQPDVVVLVGLWSIVNKNTKKVRDALGKGGIPFTDRKLTEKSFPVRDRSNKDKNYRFRYWDIQGKDKHSCRIVFWPNHPSRFPFNDMSKWNESVQRFLKECLPKDRS